MEPALTGNDVWGFDLEVICRPLAQVIARFSVLVVEQYQGRGALIYAQNCGRFGPHLATK
jgi:hypothetical protein